MDFALRALTVFSDSWEKSKSHSPPHLSLNLFLLITEVFLHNCPEEEASIGCNRLDVKQLTTNRRNKRVTLLSCVIYLFFFASRPGFFCL